jgi:murein DD-endopeptidase MepM/ murein hydrolase activator NlpD
LLHDGVDVAAPSGEPVRAAAAGVTLSAGFSGVYGEYSCVLHRLANPGGGERELTTCYGNQSAYETRPGERVHAGQVIGRVGCSGPCLRPHLHFQVRLGNSPSSPTADPARFLDPGVRIEAGRPLESG